MMWEIAARRLVDQLEADEDRQEEDPETHQEEGRLCILLLGMEGISRNSNFPWGGGEVNFFDFSHREKSESFTSPQGKVRNFWTFHISLY